MSRARIAVALLTMSAAGFATWKASEGFIGRAVIPTKNDVPTIGYGSTRYEDGRPVKMGDQITRERADVLARNLNSKEERRFIASLPGARLHPEEFGLYMDFVGQFGIGNWRASTARREILAGNYAAACHSLLRYKYSGGYDCSIPGNGICAGVWTRQLERHQKCMEAQ